MLPVLPLIVASGVLAAGTKRFSKERKPKLARVLTEAMTVAKGVDDRYQHFVQTRIDPLLINAERAAQLTHLSAGRKRIVGEHEKSINRHIAIGISAIAAVGVAHVTSLPLIPLVIATGFYLTIPLFKICWQIAAKERRLSVAHLLALYFTGMWLGGYYTIGALGMVLLGGAQKIMVLCEQEMHDSLVSVLGQQPLKVWVLLDGVETEIDFEQLQVGDVIVLDVGQMIPIDGVIVQGMASIDQHMLTGEAQPVEKSVDDNVLAATIVLAGRIQVRVEKTGSATAAAKLGDVINRNDEYRQSVEHQAIAIAEKSLVPMLAAGAVALPLLGVSSALAILGSNFTMNMVALRPLTVLNFFNTASKQGILVKDAAALEKLQHINTVVFDKTGTLTLEIPQVTQIHTFNGYATDTVLGLSAAAEYRQTHPIAQAILAHAATQQLDIPAADSAVYSVGYGLQVQVAGQQVRVGSLRFLHDEQLALPAEVEALQTSVHQRGHSLVFVAVDEVLAGALELKASIRPEAREVVQQLQAQGMTVYIMSGDQTEPTRQLAEELGIQHYFAGVLPEQKAGLVAQLQQDGNKVCFIGDGINDAIALRQADVSVSLRGATTIATDAAQIVLMNADLRQLHALLQLAQKLDHNISFNTKVAAAFSLLSGSGIVFLHLKYIAVEVLAASQLLTGVGIASKPLLENTWKHNFPKMLRWRKA